MWKFHNQIKEDKMEDEIDEKKMKELEWKQPNYQTIDEVIEEMKQL